MQNIITVKGISDFLKLDFEGLDFEVLKPCSLDAIQEKSIVFAIKYSEEFVGELNDFNDVLAIVVPEFSGKLTCSHIIAKNPKLAFSKVIANFFIERPIPYISDTAKIGENVNLGNDVIIGDYVIIGDNVKIGDRTEIRSHSVVVNAVIGSDCLIKSHAVVGEEGFGFTFVEDKQPIRMPHLGMVEIGNHVEIGGFTTVCRATLDKTILSDYVKIDDHVHIAHNVKIGKNTMVIACAEVSGSCIIGENVWIGPNSSIIDKVNIGNNAFIGIGTTVLKDVKSNAVVAGSPARYLRDRD